MTTVNTTPTPAMGNSAQTPAQAYKSAFDAMRAALATIVQETKADPLERPYSGDSYLPEHLIEAAQQSLDMAAKLQEPTPVKTQKTVTTADPRCEYWTTTKTIRGAYAGSDFFAVPIEKCHGDSDAEFAVMRAMMRAAASENAGIIVRSVLIDAGRKMTDEPLQGPTQYWTGMGFFNMVVDCLCSSAKTLAWEAWLDKREQNAAASKLRLDTHEAERRREIGLKAAATRKARREAKGGAA